MTVQINYTSRKTYTIKCITEAALINLYKSLKYRNRLVLDDKTSLEIMKVIESKIVDNYGIEKANKMLGN